MPLSSPGVGSNLDVKNIVRQLMVVERKPVALLDNKEAGYKAKISAFGALKSALFTLQKSAQGLSLTSAFSTVKASVTDATVLSASVTGVAPASSSDIEVISLARSQKLTSTGYAGTTSTVGNGTLTLSFGTYSSSATPPVIFTPNSTLADKTITIDSTNNTLAGVRDAINSANTGVTATIVNDGTYYRLSLTSKESGASNAVKVVATPSGGAGLEQLAYDGSAGGVSNLTQSVAAKNASIKVDGLAITKPSNTITDAIQGVTLNLIKETATGVTTKLMLTRDITTTRTVIEDFVKAYNDVNQQIAGATAYDASAKTGSVLTGDTTIRSIQAQLRSSLADPIVGGTTGLSMLADAGVGFQKDGTLAINLVKLDKALADPIHDLGKLFTTSDSGVVGYGARVNTLVSAMIFGGSGILNSRIDGINSSVKELGKQRNVMNSRLVDVEKRYNAQFSALDSLVSSMTKTSNFLTQQLANFPKGY